ncbi:MAG: TlpA disulfide reductase family protein [Bacteroidota bacterium]|nr:TlpA disulfide reductase family protein [Bacteroidota bacterium]
MNRLLSLTLLLGWTAAVSAQDIPSVELKDLADMTVDTRAFVEKAEGPVLFCFWATWCSPCKRELNNYADLYPDWQDEIGVELVAVSIDDPRSMMRVKPYVNSVSWDYTVLLDPNKAFARAMQVNNVPHTFLVNAEGEVVWQHNNYADGDEEELYEELLKLAE